jgi:hypothetical protein
VREVHQKLDFHGRQIAKVIAGDDRGAYMDAVRKRDGA